MDKDIRTQGAAAPEHQNAAKTSRPENQPFRVPPPGHQNAQRNYERYLALARAEALSGDRIAAENYFQHAEHYLRLMHKDRATARPDGSS
jgi:hypothetical protein